MTKALKIFLIFILSIIAISITSAMVLVITGVIKLDKLNLNFDFSSKVSDREVFNTTYDKVFTDINIDVEKANIEINESKDGNFSLVVFDKYDKLKVSDDTEKLNISLPTKRCHFFCFNETKGKVVLSIPSDYANKIKINSGYGDIKIGKFSNAKMDITADYGDITIGSVLDIVINEDYGDIEIGSVHNYLNIEDDYGDIDITSAALNKNSKIYDDYGDIEIGSINNIYVDAKTDYGKVKVNGGSKNSKITLKVETDYGDVKIGYGKKENRNMKQDEYKVVINGNEYDVVFENNPTAIDLINMLPASYNMIELNGNEKYIRFENSLVSDPKPVNHIEAGDIYLYEDDCLVIFYKSFDTIYSYTKIGHINNLLDLGTDNITVKFEKK